MQINIIDRSERAYIIYHDYKVCFIFTCMEESKLFAISCERTVDLLHVLHVSCVLLFH